MKGELAILYLQKMKDEEEEEGGGRRRQDEGD